MQTILLTSEQFIKNLTNLADNTSDKILRPAILEAQEIGLRQILGDKLIDKLITLIKNDAVIPDVYKTLLEKIQYYLAYQAVSNICMITSVKIDNSGLQRVSDERMEPVSMEDITTVQSFYQKKADYYAKLLQLFLLNNYTDYPEIDLKDTYAIKSNLYSSATCGIWLGGRRGC